MAVDPDPLHIFFLPFLAPGHMIPMVDLAKVFANHGVKATIVTTPVNARRIRGSVDTANDTGHCHHPIQVLQIPFPSTAVGLPEGCENVSNLRTTEVTAEFYSAIRLLRQPFDQLLQEHRPDCIVSDVYYTWTVDSTLELGIPRLVFHGGCSFTNTVSGQIAIHRPHDGVSSDEECFVVPGVPHRIEMRRSQLPAFVLAPDDSIVQMIQSFRRSYGSVMNSFCELESDYIIRKGQIKAWHVGPLSLCNRDAIDKALRGDKTSVDCRHCLSWLDSKEQSSVLYLCFGSLGKCTPSQLHEIALALESLSHPFIWVVKNGGQTSEWLPEGFEEKIKEEKKGLMIKGWAPQILILNHKAVGGFVTHCGWNSCMEGISAGMPMITWPLFAEQFFNERLIVDVLRTGVSVGVRRCSDLKEERGLVTRSEIEKVVSHVMGCGEEAEAMTKRAEELGVMAKKAVEVGGSSYNNMRNLIEDLVDVKRRKRSGGGGGE